VIIKSSIYAVIPTFNRTELLRRCVDSLLNQSFSIAKIVVVNSSSLEDTEDMIKQYDNDINIINVNPNWWWAKCMNVGIEYSLLNGADYILAMNDDTYLSPDALEHLLETSMLYPDSIIGGIVRDKNNSGRMINNGYGARFTRYRWIPYKKIVGKASGRDIYYSEGQSGRGVLFPASVYSKIGVYDTKNFAHRGDRDFSYRCYKEGIGQFYDSGADVFLDFKTSYEGVENKRFKLVDVKDALFHINGLYNINHQYRFLAKHYKYLWPLWFTIWILYVTTICLIRMLPFGTNLLKTIINRVMHASDS